MPLWARYMREGEEEKEEEEGEQEQTREQQEGAEASPVPAVLVAPAQDLERLGRRVGGGGVAERLADSLLAPLFREPLARADPPARLAERLARARDWPRLRRLTRLLRAADAGNSLTGVRVAEALLARAFSPLWEALCPTLTNAALPSARTGSVSCLFACSLVPPTRPEADECAVETLEAAATILERLLDATELREAEAARVLRGCPALLRLMTSGSERLQHGLGLGGQTLWDDEAGSRPGVLLRLLRLLALLQLLEGDATDSARSHFRRLLDRLRDRLRSPGPLSLRSWPCFPPLMFPQKRTRPSARRASASR